MRRYISIILIITSLFILVGCSKKSVEKEETTNVETVPLITEAETEPNPSIIPDEVPVGSVKSRLSGLYVPEEVGKPRPYTIMLNNIKTANPQSGISEADILYEALVEGGITRLMGVFEELNPERIGSVRSGRQYFASIADEYDSIFISFGESAYCSEKIAELGLAQLSGLKSESGTVFYRDPSIKAPHNAFTNQVSIGRGMDIKQYDTQYDETLNNHFTFYSEDTDLHSDQEVSEITLNFSNYTSPYFIYDNENKMYKRFQHGGQHIDANTGKQLEFKNIIVQFVDGFAIDETNTFSFRQASGDGYYITNGQAQSITWDKNEQNRSMAYYDLDGNMLQINPGNTYIAIFPGNNKSGVTLK